MITFLPEEKFYKSLPTKRIGAAGVIQNEKGEILVLKPTYKDHWLLPGGIVEAEESPLEGFKREVVEELDLKNESPRLMGVKHTKTIGVVTELLHFFYDAGVLPEKEIASIKLQDDEIEDMKFIKKDELKNFLGPDIVPVIENIIDALENKTVFYKDI